MASISDSLDQNLKEALKNKDQVKISNLRMLKAALTNERIAKMHDLSDDEEMQVVRREAKKRMDSAAVFRENNQALRAQAEESEAEFLKAFLPPEITDEELKVIVEGEIKNLGQLSPKDFGKAMGAAMKAVGNRASGERVSAILKDILNKK